jgi:hypothetical protein
VRSLSFWILTVVILACSAWANLPLFLTDRSLLRFIPPFEANANWNRNRELAYEYSNIAASLLAGKGYADPFTYPTGPTAWQPPVYPLVLAGVFWLCDGNRGGVVIVVVILQSLVLIGTGLLVTALVKQTTERTGARVATLVFLGAALWNFFACFQRIIDFWIVLLALDVLLTGLCWLGPLSRWRRAASWGVLGGLAAMVTPIVGFAWALLTLRRAAQHHAWRRLALAVACAALTIAPWAVRNYLVLGRLVPLKSNLAFEMYQSQVLQPTGLLITPIKHPYRRDSEEAEQFLALGEMAYLDRKWEQYRQSVFADPLDFTDRVSNRFLAATVWYVRFVGFEGPLQPWVLALKRLTHPLPFLALLFLVFSSLWKPLHPAQWTVIGLYALYLGPYVLVSYYDRYAAPLLGLKVLLVVWVVDRVLSLWHGKVPRSRNRKRTTSISDLGGRFVSS